MKKTPVLLTLPLLFGVIAGCSDPNKQGNVTGKITYSSKPVTGGVITLNPEKEGQSFTTSIDADGAYKILDAVPGTYVVTIETESINPDRPKRTYGPPGGAAAGGAAGGAPAPANSLPGGAAAAGAQGKYVKIPAKYADPKTSDLKITVPAGGMNKDFALTD